MLKHLLLWPCGYMIWCLSIRSITYFMFWMVCWIIFHFVIRSCVFDVLSESWFLEYYYRMPNMLWKLSSSTDMPLLEHDISNKWQYWINKLLVKVWKVPHWHLLSYLHIPMCLWANACFAVGDRWWWSVFDLTPYGHTPPWLGHFYFSCQPINGCTYPIHTLVLVFFVGHVTIEN